MNRREKYSRGRVLEIIVGSITLAAAVFFALFFVRAVMLRDQS
jgi:hypothetical protein